MNLKAKKYTLYEGTQLQRKLETEIRKTKDVQIALLSIKNKEEAMIYQKRITLLSDKYYKLSTASHLPTKMDRLKISGYRRISVK